MTDEHARSIAVPNAMRGHASPLGAVLAELWRYKLVIPAVAALITAGVTFWIMRQPKIYEAVATLEYDANPAQPLGNAVDDSFANSFWDTQEFYETQNFILRSRSIAERVARKLRLDRDPELGAGKSTNGGQLVIEGVAGRLLSMMEIAQIRDTRVVRISVRDHNQSRAQLIANAWVEAYLEKSLEDRLGTSASALKWLSEQMQNLKRDLETSELALYSFREENDSLSASLEERQKIIAGQLQSYSEALTSIRARHVQTDARLSVLREVLASDHDLLSLQTGPLATDQVVTDLRSKHRAASEELERLSLTYGAAHPNVRAADALRQSLLIQLKTHVLAIVAGVEAEVREYERAEKGIQGALDQVNQQGLALSLQEINYTRLDRERKSKSKLYDLVMERAAQTDLTRALRVANGRVVDTAVRPTLPVSPRVKLWIIVGAVLGLVMGVLCALGISYLDNKIRSPLDVEARNITVLGVLPTVGAEVALAGYAKSRRKRARLIDTKDKDLIVHLEPRSSTAECCRTIRTNITFQSADRPLRTVAVTSAMPKDGKTTVSISVATILAQSGKRVLLIDADLRKPRLHRAFKFPSGTGITSVMAGEASFAEATQTTDIPNLTLLQCGPLPPNPSELLHTRRFAEIIEEAKAHYDLVILDTPPLGAVTDPAIVATQVDGTIVVVRSGVTTRSGMDAALRQLNGVSARILGVVLNGVDLTASDYDSYYAYYRGYYAEDPSDGSPRASARSSS